MPDPPRSDHHAELVPGPTESRGPALAGRPELDQADMARALGPSSSPGPGSGIAVLLREGLVPVPLAEGVWVRVEDRVGHAPRGFPANHLPAALRVDHAQSLGGT